MIGKVSNVISLSQLPLGDEFFKRWFVFLKPLHHLSDREMDVMSSFTKHRYLLSQVIKDNNLLDTVLMSEETKRKVRADCNITLAHFQVIMGKLRKNKAIIDNKINPKLIPNIEENSKSLQLLVVFNIESE